MRLSIHVALVSGLLLLQLGIEEKSFINVCVGAVFILSGFAPIGDEILRVRDQVKHADQEYKRDKNTRRFQEFRQSLATREAFRIDGGYYIFFAGLRASYTAFYHLPFTFHVTFFCSGLALMGVALILLSPRPKKDTALVFRAADSTNGQSESFKLPEYVVRLALFASCAAMAGAIAPLLIKDEKLRLICFVTTMIVGMVGTRVLPVETLKWLLSSLSLGKLRADD
jgi:hypothetical protein